MNPDDMEQLFDTRVRFVGLRRFLLSTPLVLGGLAGCMPTGEILPSSATGTADVEVTVEAPRPQPLRDVPQGTTRMWMSDFRDAVAGMEGEWHVRVPRGSSCRLIFEPPDLLTRRGRVERRGGCFGDLFFTHFWTMTGAGELILLDMMGRPQAEFSGMTPILFRGNAVTLERAPFGN